VSHLVDQTAIWFVHTRNHCRRAQPDLLQGVSCGRSPKTAKHTKFRRQTAHKSASCHYLNRVTASPLSMVECTSRALARCVLSTSLRQRTTWPQHAAVSRIAGELELTLPWSEEVRKRESRLQFKYALLPITAHQRIAGLRADPFTRLRPLGRRFAHLRNRRCLRRAQSAAARHKLQFQVTLYNLTHIFNAQLVKALL
jgi:hypothetical protein